MTPLIIKIHKGEYMITYNKNGEPELNEYVKY